MGESSSTTATTQITRTAVLFITASFFEKLDHDKKSTLSAEFLPGKAQKPVRRPAANTKAKN